ncbi:MAG TPA: hypothetical protein VJ770_22395 [Stellaceae bacterium]|nr:hypothetical protein [Stellaceae bacterium]
MSGCRHRRLLVSLLPIALAACMNTGPKLGRQSAVVPLGVDLGSSGSEAPARSGVAPPGDGHERTAVMPSGMRMAHEGHQDAHAAGVMNRGGNP